MGKLFETVYNLESDADVLRQRPYGIIEVTDGKLSAIRLRPWPKIISAAEVSWFGGWKHNKDNRLRNRCQLYYNQPRGHRSFIALKYIVSNVGTTLATFNCAIRVLEEIARIKRTDAIVCEASNHRISDRLFARWGWERHLENDRRRHFIKRFYGEYPDSKLGVGVESKDNHSKIV